jgi:hypothetical protein
MASNVLVLQFRMDCEISLVKACFDAFRQHKEEEKFARVHYTLIEEELPKIESLS